jgi:hypothetical protein
MSESFWWVFGSHEPTIHVLMDVIGSREIAAGVEPAHLERGKLQRSSTASGS